MREIAMQTFDWLSHIPAIAAPLIELARDESVQSKVLDVARQFFSNSNITINLIPALIAGGLLLLLLPLLFLFLAPADDAGSGYGAPAAEYGAPSSSYGAPSSSYGYRAGRRFSIDGIC